VVEPEQTEPPSVLTNAFTPEYGGGTGSVVNLVTRSGGNNYHGQFLELWRPAATEASLSGFTTANATSGNDITSDTLGQTALAVSGHPLTRPYREFAPRRRPSQSVAIHNTVARNRDIRLHPKLSVHFS
jgi:hypothetical protein